MGVSKRELLEDYYFDEIADIFTEYVSLHNPQDSANFLKEVPAENFFSF